MKVICIDDKPRHKVNKDFEFILKELECYDVVDTDDHILFGESYELSVQRGVTYPAFHFIPLSDIDETEFIREYKKELV